MILALFGVAIAREEYIGSAEYNRTDLLFEEKRNGGEVVLKSELWYE